MLVELAVILILILANGVFAAAEIAIVSLRRSRLRQRVQERRRGATALVELRSRPERFLATVQVGITVVGTTAAAVGGADLAEHLEPLLRDVPVLADIADELAPAWPPPLRPPRLGRYRDAPPQPTYDGRASFELAVSIQTTGAASRERSCSGRASRSAQPSPLRSANDLGTSSPRTRLRYERATPSTPATP